MVIALGTNRKEAVRPTHGVMDALLEFSCIILCCFILFTAHVLSSQGNSLIWC